MTQEQTKEAVKQGLAALKPVAQLTAQEVVNTILNAYREGFLNAVDLVIESLWHEEDLPDKDEDIIIISGGFAKVCRPNEAYEYTGQKKWCYLCDILPEKGGTKWQNKPSGQLADSFVLSIQRK